MFRRILTSSSNSSLLYYKKTNTISYSPITYRPINFAIFNQQTRWNTTTTQELHQLAHDKVRDRVLNVVKSFEKVDPAKVNEHSHFHKDLGIDSLDATELIMSLEEEFVIEIPDDQAQKITSCDDAIKYIVSHPHAK